MFTNMLRLVLQVTADLFCRKARPGSFPNLKPRRVHFVHIAQITMCRRGLSTLFSIFFQTSWKDYSWTYLGQPAAQPELEPEAEPAVKVFPSGLDCFQDAQKTLHCQPPTLIPFDWKWPPVLTERLSQPAGAPKDMQGGSAQGRPRHPLRRSHRHYENLSKRISWPGL